MLKFLLIILIIFFLFRILGRMFVVSTFNNMNRKMEEQMRSRQNYRDAAEPEGKVTIENIPERNSGSQPGEYTPYEEVKK